MFFSRVPPGLERWHSTDGNANQAWGCDSRISLVSAEWPASLNQFGIVSGEQSIPKQADFFVLCHRYANRLTQPINALWLNRKTAQPGRCFKCKLFWHGQGT
jgi:hypothetical protein